MKRQLINTYPKVAREYLGKELIDHLMAFENRPPILVMSGFQDQSLVEEVEKQGCAGFIKKPFTISELIEWIENSLNGSHGTPAAT